MRIFEVLDGSRRKRRPCAYLGYDPAADEFALQLVAGTDPNDMPMMLRPFAERGELSIGPAWSRRWVEERIVPPSRQNIGQVLKAHGLEQYDELALLLAAEGRCSQDDFYLREVPPIGTSAHASPLPTAREELGSLFEQARLEAGLTQSELAARSGIQQAVISRLERGKGNPTVGTLEALAEGMGKRLEIRLGSSSAAGRPTG